MIIEDGGTGRTAAVTADNRLEVKAITASIEHHINHHDGRAFHIPFSQSPTASGDCIFFMQNTADEDIVIEGFTLGVLNCTADDSMYFKIGDSGTRNSATEITPVNVNAGSGISATGNFEKGADLDGGSATLSGGTEFERILLPAVTDLTSTNYNFPQDVILPKNRAISIWVDGSGTGTYYITIHFNYHSEDQG